MEGWKRGVSASELPLSCRPPPRSRRSVAAREQERRCCRRALRNAEGASCAAAQAAVLATVAIAMTHLVLWWLEPNGLSQNGYGVTRMEKAK